MHGKNILYLGIKELWSLARDPMMIVLIVFAFTVSIYTAATAAPETLNKAPIAIVDEDQSPLSQRIVGAFYRPYFMPPESICKGSSTMIISSANCGIVRAKVARNMPSDVAATTCSAAPHRNRAREP